MNRSGLLPALVAGLSAAALALDPRASLQTGASISSGSVVMLLLVYAASALSAAMDAAAGDQRQVPTLDEILPVSDWSRMLNRAVGALVNGLFCGLAGLCPLVLVIPRSVQSPRELSAVVLVVALSALQGAALGTWLSARPGAPARALLRTALGILAVMLLGAIATSLPRLARWVQALSLALPVPQASAASAGLLPLSALPAGLGLTLLFMLFAVREAVMGRRV